ncbi:ras-related protein Rap-2a [Hydra vulgaris]|uniref:small monomeric GTPase n=1 Tax=Hydra vulgaris TaxID=6087 RepID=A0ABM4BDL2_HYDVU
MQNNFSVTSGNQRGSMVMSALNGNQRGSVVMSAISPMLMIPTLSKLEKSPSLRRKNEKKVEHPTIESNVDNFKDANFDKSLKENDMRKISNKTRECNIILLGDLEIGKTAFAVRFVTRRYLHEYDLDLERTYEKTLEYADDQILVRLWDTVKSSWESYVDQADGFIVMYSVTSVKSAFNAKNIIKSIRSSSATRNLPIMMAGNKVDLEHARKVSQQEMNNFANANDCIFEEFSVACTTLIDPILLLLLKQIIQTKRDKCLLSSQRDFTGSKSSLSKNKFTRFLYR